MNNQRRANLRNAQAILRKAQESIKIAYDIVEELRAKKKIVCFVCQKICRNQTDIMKWKIE